MNLLQVKGGTWVIEANQLIPLYKLDGARCVLLDTGLPGEREELEATLAQAGLTPAGVLCSHAHIDHCANNGYLQQKYRSHICLKGVSPMKQVISTQNAPAAIGPYSQAIRAGDLLFVSGQIPLDPATGQVVEATIQAQAAQCLNNLKAILAQAGATLDNVVKTTVFLKDMEDFIEMNRVYRSFFSADCPARSAVQVARLPKDVLVEIEAIAAL